MSNQAGWECDACRKAGLEKKRRCGWFEHEGQERVVWARGGVAVTRCPRSTVTAESEALVEEFFVWKCVGAAAAAELSARQVEAFVVLENAMERERRNGERHTGNVV